LASIANRTAKKQQMKRKIIFLLIGLSAIAVRLLINFKYQLIPGINGGYYPLQIRHLLNAGSLAFADMPLLFYFDALIIKLANLVTDVEFNTLIINTIKLIDSIFYSLVLLPVFFLLKKLNPQIRLYQEIVLLFLLCFSNSSLIFVSDIQKNGFAIPFVFLFIYFASEIRTWQNKKLLFFTGLSFIMLALSHFGAFAITLFMLLVYLAVKYKKKALLPIFLITIFAVFLIAVFDSVRAIRLITIALQIFQEPAISQGLSALELMQILFSYTITALGLWVFHKKKQEITAENQVLLKTLLIIIFIFSLPLFAMEYLKRIQLMLFVPQFLAIAILWQHLKKKSAFVLMLAIILFSLLPALQVLKFKKPSISYAAFQDLKNIKQLTDNETIIIARHGLEWWVAWQLECKIANEKARNSAIKKHKTIIFLEQRKGRNILNSQSKSIFTEVKPAKGSKKIYSSNYFVAYRLQKSSKTSFGK